MKKKGAMSDDEILGLILGVIAVVILIFLATKLYFEPKNENAGLENAAESYFNTFVEEIKKADEGNIGTFTMWQEFDKSSKEDIFLIYFAGKYKYSIGYRTFVSYNNNNTVCTCSWFDEAGDCKKNNCIDLAHPIRYEGSLEPFAISSGDQIKIELKDEEYFITKVDEDKKIQEEYIPGKVVSYLFYFDSDDVFLDENGEEYRFISFVDDEGDWELFLEDKFGVYVSVQGRNDEIFIDYKGIGEIIISEVGNEE